MLILILPYYLRSDVNCNVFSHKDPDGEHARRVLQRMGGGQQGGRGQDMGPGGMNIPHSIANNPNIPPEVIHALQAGRLGTTVFVANVRTRL